MSENTHFGENRKKGRTLEARLIFWISSERISNAVCKLCKCWAVICIGECKLRSAFPSFTVVASGVGAPGIRQKIKGGPVQQAFPSVKYKRFLYLKGGKVCMQMAGWGGGDVLSNAEGKKTLEYLMIIQRTASPS
jgi:hypothetical protein